MGCGTSPRVWKVQKDPWLAVRILHSCPWRAVALNQDSFTVHEHLTVPRGRPTFLTITIWGVPGISQVEARMLLYTLQCTGKTQATAKTSAVWRWETLSRTDISSMQCTVKSCNSLMLLCLMHIWIYKKGWKRTVVSENHEKHFLLLLRCPSAHHFLKAYAILKWWLFGREIIKNESAGQQIQCQSSQKGDAHCFFLSQALMAKARLVLNWHWMLGLQVFSTPLDITWDFQYLCVIVYTDGQLARIYSHKGDIPPACS